MILALDQGTTSSRAILFDLHGSIVRMAQREFPQHYPKPGWVEHDPAEIWSSQLAVMREVAEAPLPAGGLVQALGVTNQRETTVVWDRRTLEPIAPAIVWQDRRTAEAMAALAQNAALAHDITARTGLVLDAYFSASKIAWLLEHVPHARVRAEAGELACGTVDSYLIAKLTGGKVHVTDSSNASRTMLFNLETLAWDPVLLEAFNIPISMLPTVVPSAGVVGVVDDGLPLAGIPIAGIAGDQQAATFGQACFAPGDAKCTYGTGAFILMNTGNRPVRSSHRLLSTVGWTFQGETAYALEGAVFMAGAIVQWLRDGLGVIQHARDIEALAASVPDSGGVVMVPAFTGLGAPHWDASARGTLLGMTRGTTAAHVARAALEAIALQVADVMDAMRGDAPVALRSLRVDGGASANNLLMQTQANLLGVEVIRPKVVETTALGAAYLAGLGVGVFSSPDALAQQWQQERCFKPEPSAYTRALREDWLRAVERAKQWRVNG
jgi:glycerol kinase